MENNLFLELIDEELVRQRKSLNESRRILEHSPRGHLKFRQRKTKKSFYIKLCEGDAFREHNVTGDMRILRRMVKKELSKITAKSALNNIHALERLQAVYEENSPAAVIEKVSKAYREAMKESGYKDAQQWKEQQSKQYYYDPQKHIHETVSGIKVRSKSEALIANVLTSYGIVFYYEKPFLVPGSEGEILYPDFTIVLPDGKIILWEHLGLLSDRGYCAHNAEKLHIYQQSGYVIGENLIITQDDINGGCSSKLIHHIVKEYLAPYFN